jgi:hypothetical protein
MNCIKFREELEKDLLKARIYYSNKIDIIKEKKKWWMIAPFSQTDVDLIKHEFRLEYVENMYRMISNSTATTVTLDLWEFNKVYEYEETQ